MTASAVSQGFELLAEPIRRWIWRQGWQELRDIQERAIPLLIQQDADVIIAAATAGGKTEAAFLPLLSRLLERQEGGSGFGLLYVSPLKALINDQFRRLDDVCAMLEVPVHRWHGDVAASAKTRARKQPSGVLLITPESLEALFVLRGLEIPRLFAALECVVIDELHALLDTERGMHLRSLLSRLELSVGRPVRRVGLSATLGDMRLAAAYLRPDRADSVQVLESFSEGQELRLLVRGYVIRSGDPAAAARDATDESPDAEPASDRAIAEHVFSTLRGTQNLVFAGSRSRVELYADLLRQMCEAEHLPNEFYPHHANLASDHREFVERRLKEGREPTTAVCTSTLELGIDIGEVASVAQIGPPFSVASMRQRLGRSGRRAGRPAVMRTYIQERALEPDIHLLDELRLHLVQTIAMTDLLINGWCEPPRPRALHLSTLVHQILAVIAQRGGASARALFHILCDRGAFSTVDRALFTRVLRAIGAKETGLIEQSPDGTLLLGATGERLVGHYSFYAVFMTPEEYRVVCDGRTLGTLPVSLFLVPETTIVFSGRRWVVLSVCDRDKLIEVRPAQAGLPPRFGGDGADLHDQVALRMREIYERDDVAVYLDAVARDLLAEGRRTFLRRRLATEAARLRCPRSNDDLPLARERCHRVAGPRADLPRDQGLTSASRVGGRSRIGRGPTRSSHHRQRACAGPDRAGPSFRQFGPGEVPSPSDGRAARDRHGLATNRRDDPARAGSRAFGEEGSIVSSSGGAAQVQGLGIDGGADAGIASTTPIAHRPNHHSDRPASAVPTARCFCIASRTR